MKYLLDDIDLEIIHLFAHNSRVSFRSMSSVIGLTSKSIKARIDKMISKNIIRSFFLIVNPSAFGYTKICVVKGRYGDKVKDDELLKMFSTMGCILTRIQYLGRGFGYSLAIKDKSDDKITPILDSLDKTIKYRIFQLRYGHGLDLGKTDLKIIKCLLANSRMDVNHIAGQISLSGKTVTRHLDRMIQNHVLSFSVICDSSSTSGYLQFSITLRVDEAKYYFIHEYISRKFSKYILYAPRSFANPPNEMRFFLFGNSLSAIELILIKLESIDGVKSVDLFVVLELENYSDWIINEIDQRL